MTRWGEGKKTEKAFIFSKFYYSILFNQIIISGINALDTLYRIKKNDLHHLYIERFKIGFLWLSSVL
jgi:hypothetical protein